MLEKSRGIVLHNLRYGESSLICHIFTEKHGRRSFIIKGGRSKKSRSRSNLIQPLFILDLEYYYKENKDLLSIKEFSRALPLNFLSDPLKSAQVLLLSEILYRSLHAADPDPELFEFLIRSIEFFDVYEGNTGNFHLSFLLKLTRYLGISPPSLPGEGLFERKNFSVMENALPVDPVKKEQVMLTDLYHKNYSHSLDIQISRKERNRLLEFILNYYTANHYSMEKLRSWTILREVFDS